MKPATQPSTSTAEEKHDQGSDEISNCTSVRQPWSIRRHEIINEAFQEDDGREAQESQAQNERNKAFALKPFKVVQLSNDESNIKVSLKS